MRDLFSSIVSGGEAEILRLVQERTQEGVQLEFKAQRLNRSGGLQDEDAVNLGSTLSAFSNSMGGLLIWGVEAKKDAETNIDCASRIDPIPEIDRFKSEVVRRVGQILMPRNDGILVEAIPSDSKEGHGYIAIFVERSERRPHRSEAKGDKYYYKRVGDSSYAMEHYDIEDSFKRMTTAELEVNYTFGRNVLRGDGIPVDGSINIHIYLKNELSTSARFPYIYLTSISRANHSNYAVDGSGKYGLPLREDGGTLCFEGGADDIIHPGTRRAITSVNVKTNITKIDTNTNKPNSFIYSIDFSEGEYVTIEYQTGSEHSRAKTGTISISPREMATFIGETYLRNDLIVAARRNSEGVGSQVLYP
ncbi:hypothetical protein GAY33_19170 [Azospirillum brasilense]|uniref:AlbA family DNA-binding domain-containing protein n=1 Tax=Azospirillum argentinense TaxID=2970906 RepID=UPI00190E9C82|nr:ATP-binding protein [Azospirillum argentinense]MBK3801312.1 hypothetical protein [Azospirillum argentinense]